MMGFKIINRPINKRSAQRPYVPKKYVLRSARDATLITGHRHLRVKYGLRNLRELCMAYHRIDTYRKAFIVERQLNVERADAFTVLLRRKGILTANQHPLELKVENILQRRLQTIIARGSKTFPQQISLAESRQMIVHGHVRVNGRRERMTSLHCNPGLVLTITLPRRMGFVEYVVPENAINKTEDKLVDA